MIILFGAAGSGKSLQGQKLAEKYDWRWMSVGQLLRDCKDPELEKTMLKGELVSDEFVVNMMHREMMASLEKRQFCILDGYPRDEWQAQWIADKGDIEKRWALFEATIDNMVTILRKGGLKIAEVDGLGEIDTITERIETVLKEWQVLPEERNNG